MDCYSNIKRYSKKNNRKLSLHFFFGKIQRKIFVFENRILFYLPMSNIEERGGIPSVIVRRATMDDLDKFEEIEPETNFFKDFLKKNDIIIIALLKDIIIGHVIFEKNIQKKYTNIVNLKSDELWLRNAFTLPSYRNKGIYSLILSYSSELVKKLGYSNAYVSITSDNQKSIEIHTIKFKAQPLLRYKYLKFLFFEKTWV